jgi:protein-S-isoprenylcysteine O-methyltransferase Ste14
MRKTIAVLGSALFFAVAPSVLAGLIPWSITHWEFRPPFFDLQATRALGMLLIAAGLPGLIDSFARFALQGLGTPAPIAPPHNLVVTGLYRYVRNPMYVAVVAVILGQGILFGDWRLLIYGGLMWLAFHAFVLAYEEPVLAESFGPVRGFLGECPTVDSAAVSMAHRIGLPFRRRTEATAHGTPAADAAKPAGPCSRCRETCRAQKFACSTF